MSDNENTKLSLKQLMQDDTIRDEVRRYALILKHMKDTHKDDTTPNIAIITVNFEMDNHEECCVDLGIELLYETKDSIVIRIGTNVLGMYARQEECYAKVVRGRFLDMLMNYNVKKPEKPLVELVYEMCSDAVEHNKLYGNQV